MSIGTSTLYSTEWVITRLRELRPTSILDVGCGWGRWGFLAREFLEVWDHRFSPEQWSARIDALDVHPGTWTPVHPFVYDRCIEADIRDWEPEPYDVAIACDVIEHLEASDGERVLKTLLAWCGKVIVGLPLGPGWLRAAHDGNPHEAHLAEWTDVAFSECFDPSQRRLTQTEDGLGYGLYVLG